MQVSLCFDSFYIDRTDLEKSKSIIPNLKLECKMAKSSRGTSSSHPKQGGNWPSTTGKPSGKGRGNAPTGK